MFQNFPYTDMHQLNLDWVIAIVKDFKEHYPEIVQEINNKLNKPAINPDGSLNDILMSNGDGTTKWGNIADVAETEIYAAVAEWLDEHPEATTTVQDDSLEMQKFVDSVKYLIRRNQSGTIAPVYIGDYLTDYNYLPSSIVRRGDEFVVINAPTRDFATAQSSGNGYVQRYSLVDNEKKSDIVRLVGHGNSLAFDGTHYYVVPVWEYANNTETRTNKVYVYDIDFVMIATLEAPAIGVAVSFDPVTETLYYWGTGGIYVIENNQFSLYCNIANFNAYQENIILDRSFNQDMAIYNNEFYLSSPTGIILHGYLQEETSSISDTFYVTNFDSTGRFILGELEGMEFDASGHLYALMYSNVMVDVLRNAFVMELPVNMINATSPVMLGHYYADDPTVTLSNATQNAFYLNTYEIRSINQLMVRTNRNTTQVTIPSDADVIDNYPIRLTTPVCLNLNGKYTCIRFIVQVPGLTISPNNNTHQLTFTQQDVGCIFLERTGTCVIAGGYNLNVSTPNISDNTTNNFIHVGYFRNSTIIRLALNSLESMTLCCGSRPILGNAFFLGGMDVFHIPQSFAIRGQFGYVTESTKKIRLFVTFPRAITSTPTLSGSTTLRSALGYVDGANVPISFSDTANYNFTVVRNGDYEAVIEITKTSGNAFTNINNNTPVVGDGVITFSFA